MTKIRVNNGFVEIDYERFAQILPKVDERTLRESIEGLNEDERQEVYDEGHEDGYREGREAGEEAGAHDLNDRIEIVLDKLLKSGEITTEIHDLLCERLPTP